ncbi:MAG: ACP S-malonyltransferase [Bacteroidales bacterium]|nr:ACP S-malonyltransferase [Bacteroidales bacterium]
MKEAHVFPGQGAQFSGMGKELYEQFPLAQQLFVQADAVLGFPLSEIMFTGSDEELKQTKVTQPAVFLHAYVAHRCLADREPDMVAGHSLGELTALVVNGCLSFEEGLVLVSHRAHAMQRACEAQASGMVAVLKFDDQVTEQVCADITDEVVVPANYNSPQQLVISGSLRGLEMAQERLREAGAKRLLPLNVGGAFHSPLMRPAQDELAEAIEQCHFRQPSCPIYQNATAQPSSDPETIKRNLLVQLTSPVRWAQSVRQMIADGATRFVEFGPGNALQGLIKRIDPDVEIEGK